MDLYLIRHAEAIDLGERGVTEDEHRPLTERGERQSEALGVCLREREIQFDAVVSSPLLRAKQTAEIVLKASGQTNLDIRFTPALVPDAKPKELARFLLKSSGERIALVGHLPHMAVFAAWLIGGKRAQLEIKKAAIALVSCGSCPMKGNGVLHWLVNPSWYMKK